MKSKTQKSTHILSEELRMFDWMSCLLSTLGRELTFKAKYFHIFLIS